MRALSALALVLLFSACASSSDEIIVDYYKPAFRQLPPEPVYGRLAWSMAPQPIKPRVRDTAPFLMPNIVFTMPNARFDDALQTLAQSIGYGWEIDPALGGKRIAVNMQGPIDEIAVVLEKQVGGSIYLDHENRIVRAVVVEAGSVPPSARLE